MERARYLAGHGLVAAAAATWGLWSLVLRPAESFGPLAPSVEVLVVFVVVFLVVSPLALLEPRPATRRPLRAWLLLAAYGVADAGNALFFFWAMQRTTLAVAVLTHYLAPLIVALLAPLLLGEKLRAATLGALALALVGLTLTLEPWQPGALAGLDGALLGGLSALFYAALVLLSKKLATWFSPREAFGYHMLPGALVLLPFLPAGPLFASAAPAAILCGGALVSGVAAGLAFMVGLQRIEASHTAVLTLLEPLVAVGAGAVVWGQVPGPLAALGGLLILGGGALVVRPAPDQPLSREIAPTLPSTARR